MEIKDCPEKLQKMINELKKEYLEVLDYFLEHACNLPSEQRICKFSFLFNLFIQFLKYDFILGWHKIRRVLDGKEKVTTIKELSSYEDLLCNMRNFLEKKAKTVNLY